jgi:hypothetical protein
MNTIVPKQHKALQRLNSGDVHEKRGISNDLSTDFVIEFIMSAIKSQNDCSTRLLHLLERELRRLVDNSWSLSGRGAPSDHYMALFKPVIPRLSSCPLTASLQNVTLSAAIGGGESGMNNLPIQKCQ